MLVGCEVLCRCYSTPSQRYTAPLLLLQHATENIATKHMYLFKHWHNGRQIPKSDWTEHVKFILFPRQEALTHSHQTASIMSEQLLWCETSKRLTIFLMTHQHVLEKSYDRTLCHVYITVSRNSSNTARDANCMIQGCLATHNETVSSLNGFSCHGNQLRNVGDDVMVTVHQCIIAVSYTHLTLPTIYSV